MAVSGWHMNNLLRLLAVGGLCAFAVLAFAVGIARNSSAPLAPVHLVVFMLALGLYLVPVFVAMYRQCAATVWIAVVDVLLGWTIAGWFVAFGWAVAGEPATLPPRATPQPVHPVPKH